MKFRIASSILPLLFTAHLTHAQSYSITQKFHIPGDGGWDYIFMDDAASRLYVSHGTMVQVLDVTTGKVVGMIPDTKGVHGVALAHEFNKGFTSNGRDSTLTVFDLHDYSIITRVHVTGANPDAILYDGTSHRVLAFNGRSGNATVVDAASNNVIGTIALDGKPEFAVSDGRGTVYVNIEDKSEVCAIDPVKMTVLRTWSIAPGEEPSGLAIDAATNRLFSVCGNKKMIVSDAIAGKVIATLPIGGRVDGAAFDPQLKRAYSSNGEGTMTVVQEIDANTFKVLANIPTQKGARTIAVDTKTHRLYLPTADFGAAPAATQEHPHPRPALVPGTFAVIEVAPQ